jgi:hypothetical protein
MSDLTVVNDDGVQRVSASLATIHDNFHSAFQTLKTTLAQHDGAWGNDNMGSHFASGYVPGANQAKENFQTAGSNDQADNVMVLQPNCRAMGRVDGPAGTVAV